MIEYIVVSDVNSKVLLSTTEWFAAVKLAGKIRAAGGECTILNRRKVNCE